MTRILAILILCALATGCATTGNADYARYADSVREQQAAEAQQFAALANTAAACNGSEVCVVSVTALAAMALNRGGGQSAQIAPPQRELHWTEKVAHLSNALTPWGGFFAQIEGQRFNRDIALSNNETQRDIIGGITGGWERSNSAAYEAFGVASQRATYQVTGDYVTGTQTIVGGDQIGRDQFRGDWRTGDDTRRDTIGGDRTDYGTGNRLNSPNTRTTTTNDAYNVGQRCTGIGCQALPLPEPEGE
jgi:hypothetical protein